MHALGHSPTFPNNAQNTAGSGWCPEELYNQDLPDLKARRSAIARDHLGFMQSPAHRDTILNPHWTKVDLGIHWHGKHFAYVQQFSDPQVTWDAVPWYNSSTGTLILRGQLGPDHPLRSNASILEARLHYDPLPRPLTPGQLARTYCHGEGIPVALVSPPQNNTHHAPPVATKPCPRPQDQPTNPPTSYLEAQTLFDNARTLAENASTIWHEVERIHAETWQISPDNKFNIIADIGPLLRRTGPGIYTITLVKVDSTGIAPDHILARAPITHLGQNRNNFNQPRRIAR